MKSHKILALGITVMMSALACKKNDLHESNPTEQPGIESINLTAPASASAWKNDFSWESSKQKSFSVHFTTVKDANITASVADQGLVLVYKKNGTAISSLPIETKVSGGSQYWYYQVSEGTLMIAADSYGSAGKPQSSDEFSYIILSSEQLSTLESKGKSRADLMATDYNQVLSLLQ